MKCGTRQQLLPNGLCRQCPPYMESRGFYCIQVQCKPNEILRIDGQCQACKPRTIPSADKLVCEAITCESHEFKTYDGICQKCPEYTIVTPDGHNCRMPYCKNDEVFKSDGSCGKCPLYTRPVHHGFYCRAEHCLQDEVLQENGSCYKLRCPHNHVRLHPLDNHCHKCDDFSRPNGDKTKCITDVCAVNQLTNKEGHCIICPPYHIAEGEPKTGQKCVKPTCDGNNIVTLNGICTECPMGQVPAPDGHHCVGEASKGGSGSGGSSSTTTASCRCHEEFDPVTKSCSQCPDG